MLRVSCSGVCLTANIGAIVHMWLLVNQPEQRRGGRQIFKPAEAHPFSARKFQFNGALSVPLIILQSPFDLFHPVFQMCLLCLRGLFSLFFNGTKSQMSQGKNYSDMGLLIGPAVCVGKAEFWSVVFLPSMVLARILPVMIDYLPVSSLHLNVLPSFPPSLTALFACGRQGNSSNLPTHVPVGQRGH